MERTTTKIYKEDLDALRKLKEDHRLHGIADSIAWLLDQHEGRKPPGVKLLVEIGENDQGGLTATVCHHYLK